MIPGLSKYMSSGEGVEGKVKKFEVYEVPKFFPSGEGMWYWVLFEKEGVSTFEAIRKIAAEMKIDERDVGYAGLKDKHAKTLQWISLPKPPERFPFKIYCLKKNERKLKVGALLGNWFRIVFETNEVKKVVEVLDEIKNNLPNGFGIQRFSKVNHRIGELLVKGKKKEAIKLMKKYRIPLKKKYFIFMQDAYTSFLFNKVLNERIPHTEVWEGDIVGRFGPTGPIYGKKVPLAGGKQGEIERKVLEEEGLSLQMFKNKGKRRALFVPLKGLKYKKRSKEVEIRFFLPKGSYATMVLREIMKEKFTWPFLSFSF